jgi:ABC-type iron transport system FetAB ATPase subunit
MRTESFLLLFFKKEALSSIYAFMTVPGSSDGARLRVSAPAGDRLAAVELALGAGKCLAITGPSGAGKSLLLRMIADLDLHEGEAWLDGRRRSAMKGPEWRSQVVYCAPESGWWHAVVGAHFGSHYPLTLAAQLGLTPGIFEQEVRLCSTGERQRLALLRSLSRKPPVLLLDEPTGPLDPESVARVEAVLLEHLARGAAIVIVTHDPAQAARLGGEQLSMRGGRLSPA